MRRGMRRKIISVILILSLLLSSIPMFSFAAQKATKIRFDGFESYEEGRIFKPDSGIYRAFGSYSEDPEISSDFAYKGKYSVCMSGVSNTSASFKVLNFLQRKITKEDVGKTFKISFMIYPDKNSGVYSSKGDTPSDCTPFTKQQLKESTGTRFRFVLAGPDGQNYKYRKGNVAKGYYVDFDAAWNTWTKAVLSYKVTEDFLDDGSQDQETNPYIDSFRIMQTGIDYSVNQGLCNTYYVDNVTIETVMPDVSTERFDGMEDYEAGKTMNSSGGLYRSFGGQSNNALITDEIAYEGKNSICLSGVYGTSASLKILNFLQRDITKNDLGNTYKISFMIYPKKSAGVYSAAGTSVEDCISFTKSELKKTTGTKFNVILAGPDGQNYTYRTGSKQSKHSNSFYAAWDEWTEVTIYYTVEEDYLSTGSEGDLSDPYIDSLRIIQNGLDFSVNEGLCNTYFVDNFSVSKVDAMIEYACDENEIAFRTSYLETIGNEYARTIVSEYDSKGMLLNTKVGEKVSTGLSAGAMTSSMLFYTPKAADSEIYVTVMSGLGITPATTKIKVEKSLPDNEFLLETKGPKRAKEMLELSKATYTDAISSNKGFDKENSYFYPTDDTYYHLNDINTNYGDALELFVSPDRYGVLKFDISNESAKSVSNAYLRLFTKAVISISNGNPPTIDLYNLSDGNWNEASPYSSLPSLGDKISSGTVEFMEVTYYFDISSYINKALKEGKKSLSFLIKCTDYVVFTSMEGIEQSFKPCLIFEGRNLKEGAKAVSSFDYSNYIDVMKTRSVPEYEKTPTRVLESVTDYTKVTKMPKLSKYGGWIDGGKYDATGFFRTQLIDGRWWIIDPLGYKMIYMGVTGVSVTTSSDITKTAFENKYGTVENWQTKIHDELRSYGFNSAGSWSKVSSILSSPETVTPLNVVGFNKAFIKTYDNNGDNILNVFDPGFETAADSYAKTYIAPYADSPYIIGWNTDNEPIANDDMLMDYLNSDPKDINQFYNYYTAWEWLKSRHGNNASLSDITAKDKNDWVEFVYDRYMKVCHDAIRKYDKNHMIIGPKMNKPYQGAFRGVKNWVDIVGYDYYGNAWTGDLAQIEQWYKWAGKPFINTEWYAKGMDACTEESGLTNKTGIGYTVQTQDARGYYYQSFILSMLESKLFVGWQWFRYIDNDPSDPTETASNSDANKGIITRKYEYYTALMKLMKEINMNAYDLTKYFDN